MSSDTEKRPNRPDALKPTWGKADGSIGQAVTGAIEPDFEHIRQSVSHDLVGKNANDNQPLENEDTTDFWPKIEYCTGDKSIASNLIL